MSNELSFVDTETSHHIIDNTEALMPSGRKKGPRKVFKEEIYALDEQGWSVWQIARKMNIARRTVLRVLREHQQLEGELC